MNKILSVIILIGFIGFSTAALADETDDKNAKPVLPPAPNYPERALAQGIEGTCLTYFDVSPEGQTENITADCTHQSFCDASIEAISKVEFYTKVVAGELVRRTGVEYPFEYYLGDGKPSDAPPGSPRLPCAKPDETSMTCRAGPSAPFTWDDKHSPAF